ncbi:hypothetical protein BO70DRAFT_360728 [Aspergillus heteromorphus CBS 117.55]|uniref:Uncharacterized protein n=1 Tax=Aspergillus heteromorphus CBS 117.55 TaxID=1448321 RepID=A0A317WL14_9EURO|nr:uncharacterized protein BO70DRAFT_360728 [Aspergillus heteromorphus CBS 117.55]PWY86999.1 hypothetical protein BO70DRAFT_360728 [Aspergillus heteromorphus CBS 117.55]
MTTTKNLLLLIFFWGDIFALLIRLATGEWTPKAKWILACSHVALWMRALDEVAL